jgi:hypothetical protein
MNQYLDTKLKGIEDGEAHLDNGVGGRLVSIKVAHLVIRLYNDESKIEAYYQNAEDFENTSVHKICELA